MIDLHSHVLHGLDDGAKDLKNSLEMCLNAARDGITHLAATPHYHPDDPAFEPETVSEMAARLNQALKNKGVNLTLVAGAEVMLSVRLPELAQAGRLPTLGPDSRYFLLELPLNASPRGLNDLVFKVGLSGLTPIICHPERTWCGSREWDWLENLARQGCLVQLTAMSLTGRFGKEVRRTAETLARLGLCHLVASDAHSPDHRPPKLSEARERLAKMFDEDTAEAITEYWPGLVLAGKTVYPELPPLKRRWSFPWR